MNKPKLPECLLLFRGTEWFKGLSPEEMQTILKHMNSWVEGLAQNGKLKVAQPLERTAKIVSGKRGSLVADGPFPESKEAIGGYFLLQVDSFDEAVKIARKCPALRYGAEVEVRPIAETASISESE
jgi:hypothetical protein